MVAVVRVGKVFLGVVTIEACVIVVFQILNLLGVGGGQSAQNNADILYGAIIIFSLVFFVYFAYDGILGENFIQIVAFLLFTLLMGFYVIYQYAQRNSNPILLIQMIVVLACELIYAGLGWKLYLEFGWRIYKKIGADPKTRNMYRTFQIFLTLVKMDFQFQFVLIAQNLVLVLKITDYEWYINVAAIPIIIAVVYMGVTAVKKELPVFFRAFLFIAIIEPSYIIFRCFKLLTVQRYTDEGLPITVMVAAGAVSLVIRAIMVFTGIRAHMNFGQGLKEHINKTAKTPDDKTNFGSFSNRRMTVV